jgi:hypothetical protein
VSPGAKRMPAIAIFSVTTPSVGAQGERARDLAGTGELFGLGRRYVPIAQPDQGSFMKRGRARARHGIGAAHMHRGIAGDEILVPGSDKIGAIDLKQGFAAAHDLTA